MSREPRFPIVLLFSVAAAACAGEDGTSFLTDLNEEPAGANCATGGIRVDTGPDDNGNNALESGEIASTKYVCGKQTLTSVTPESAGTNCSAGGVKIQLGADANANGTLDGAEVMSTNYVCGAGEAIVSKAFSIPGVPANMGTPMTILSHSITTTSGGDLLAIGASDAFCTPAECPAGNPAGAAYLWISDSTDMVAAVAEYDYFFLQPSITQSVTRSARFSIPVAGTYTFNLKGQDVTGDLTYYRNGLTLVFIP